MPDRPTDSDNIDTALILVDIQKDFMPDGALPTRAGYQVVPVANELMQHFDLVVASQDWHPPEHGSFASNHDNKSPGEVIELDGLEQILWPDHCVQESEGADLVDDLNTDGIDRIFTKGTDPLVDSYSAFFDNDHRNATGMGEFLAEREVERVVICGVATDYCVKFTTLDACKLGLETWVVIDGLAGVGNEVEDIDKAVAEMRTAGAHMIDSGVAAAHLGR